MSDKWELFKKAEEKLKEYALTPEEEVLFRCRNGREGQLVRKY
ncbi:hypothetical protein [Ammoniphilus sp. CFH 90114]|nr:hypothetical protein [Ammoniphilus sp. CFH 90114]